jgi:hypothetical protein
MRIETPFFSYSQYGEIIIGSLLQHSFHRVGGFHDHKSRAPTRGFRECLGDHPLHFLFDARVRPSWADNMQKSDLSLEATG